MDIVIHMKNNSYLIVGSSENNSDLLYRTAFFVPDSVIYIEHKNKKTLVLNDLEYERGLKEADVDEVISYNECIKELPKEKRKKSTFVDVIELILNQKKIKSVMVQKDYPLFYADELRARGIKLTPVKRQFLFKERLKKSENEIKKIKYSLNHTSKAMDAAIRLIQSSKIKGSRLYVDGQVLTAERVKEEINGYLARQGFTSSHTIVSSGIHSTMPHHTGSGYLHANSPVIIDIFPRSQESGYYGDMTRTVIRGEPTSEQVKMYNTVLRGQKLGISLVKAGIKARDVHSKIIEFFEKCGFKTQRINGRPQGFIHSTGHGLGLDIHEPPRIGDNDAILEEGNVVTVEPGLYYEKLGGVRIEDVVAVTSDGCRNLTRFRKKFRI